MDCCVCTVAEHERPSFEERAVEGLNQRRVRTTWEARTRTFWILKLVLSVAPRAPAFLDHLPASQPVSASP